MWPALALFAVGLILLALISFYRISAPGIDYDSTEVVVVLALATAIATVLVWLALGRCTLKNPQGLRLPSLLAIALVAFAIGMFAAGLSLVTVLLGVIAASTLVWALGKTIVRGPPSAWAMLALASLMILGIAVVYLLWFGLFAAPIGLALLIYSVVKFAKSVMVSQH